MAMALTGVLRPGHPQLRVTDLDQAVHFYPTRSARPATASPAA